MKKLFLFLFSVIAFCLASVMPATAQNEVTLDINAKTGDWTASGSPTYASEYATASQDPGVRIQHWARNNDHRNNMYFYDGTNLGIYSAFGSTESEDYRIYPSTGWYVKAVSFDFVTGVHPSYKNPDGVQVSVNGGEEVVSYGVDDLQHFEVDDLDEEAEYAVLTIAQVDKPAFAHTSNFKVTLAKKTALEVAWEEFAAAFNKYSAYSEDDFPAGTEPGCYAPTAVEAFFKAVSDAAPLDGAEDPDEITEAQLKSATKAMDDAYEAMLATKVPFAVTNGYYRFRAAMEYNDGEPRYMSCGKSGDNFIGYWSALADPEDTYASIWKVTKSGDNYDVVNVMNNTRYNGTRVSNAMALTTEAADPLAFDAVRFEDASYLNIRLSSAAANAGNYLHQGSHGNGSGTSGLIVTWYSLGEPGGTPKLSATEWVVEAVSEGDISTARAAYNDWKAHQDLVAQYTPLFTTAAGELAKAQDGCEGEALITSADQFYSECSDSDEGQDFGALIDGETSSYWHSDWHSGNVPDHSHWLQVDLSEATYSFVRMTVTRRPVVNDHITRWGVFGSDDADASEEEWTEVATLFTPYGNNKETISGLVFDGKGFKHLRFYIDGTSTGRGYGHMSEFQLYKVESLAETAFGKAGASATTLESVITAQKDFTSDDITQSTYNTLKSAYDAFHSKFSDPTEMRELIQAAEGLAAGIILGDNPGQWSNASVVDALKSALSAAKAYDEAGNYDPATTANHVSTLTAQMEAVKAAANPIKADTWYRIRFGTEEEFTAGGWDLVAGAATETDDALWGKYVAVAKYADGGHESLDPYDVRIGSQLYFLDASLIDDDDKALFRFIDKGEQGYLLQNKATGLFLKAAGTSGAVTLSIIPSFFTASALGYGQNLIAAKDLAGNAQSYLHAQVSHNVLVTYNAYTLGSRSGLYLEDAGSASDVDTDFSMDIIPGRFYSFCYPVDLSTDEGKMLTVSSAQGTVINLSSTSGAAAGEPFFYLYGEPSEYSADNTPEAITFKHGMTIANEPKTEGAIKGTYVSKSIGQGYVVVDTNNPSKFSVTRQLLGGSVPANSAYIESSESLPYTADLTIIIDGETVIDGVRDLEGTLKSVYTNGDIYTLDGRRVAKGNLDTLRTLGRGIYIINGVKVAVK